MSLEQIVKKNKSKALSNFDLLKLVDGLANVVIYDQIYKYKTVDELLGPYGAVFILYLFKPKYGHWCCLIKRTPKIIEFFDSYGGPPDEVLDHIPKDFKKKSHQDYCYLSRLLWQSPYSIEYNDYNFQKHGANIKTCGRFAALRVMLKHLTLKQFARIFNDPHSDDLATFFTM